jgi:thiamine kinase
MIPEEILPLIPGCAHGRPPRAVLPLPGGRGCNSVLRVDTEAGRFVLRQRRLPLDRPGSAAHTELRSQVTAAGAGLAPPVVNAALDGSWLLMEFIDAPLWTEQQLFTGGVDRLGERLAQLHSLTVPVTLPVSDIPRIAAGYLQQLRESDPGKAQSLGPLLNRVEQLSLALEGLADKPVLNHGDLQLGNILGPLPFLIDWEYAQIVDPTYDIACLLAYYPALEPQLDRLLGSAGLSNLADQAALSLQRERFACLNRLWEAVNSSKAG